MSSIPGTSSAPSATWPSAAARSPPWSRGSTRPAPSRPSTSAGLYVTPGLVDIHVHVFAGTGERRSYAGDNSVYPDGFTLRSGVTSRGRRRLRRLAQLRGLQVADHRSRADPRLRLPQHRRRRHARCQDRAEARGHAGPARGRDGAPPQGADRRHQDRPLHGQGLRRRRSGPRGGQDRRDSRHGRLRPRLPDEVAGRAADPASSAPATFTRTSIPACAASWTLRGTPTRRCSRDAGAA